MYYGVWNLKIHYKLWNMKIHSKLHDLKYILDYVTLNILM